MSSDLSLSFASLLVTPGVVPPPLSGVAPGENFAPLLAGLTGGDGMRPVCVMRAPEALPPTDGTRLPPPGETLPDAPLPVPPTSPPLPFAPVAGVSVSTVGVTSEQLPIGRGSSKTEMQGQARPVHPKPASAAPAKPETRDRSAAEGLPASDSPALQLQLARTGATEQSPRTTPTGSKARLAPPRLSTSPEQGKGDDEAAPAPQTEQPAQAAIWPLEAPAAPFPDAVTPPPAHIPADWAPVRDHSAPTRPEPAPAAIRGPHWAAPSAPGAWVAPWTIAPAITVTAVPPAEVDRASPRPVATVPDLATALPLGATKPDSLSIAPAPASSPVGEAVMLPAATHAPIAALSGGRAEQPGLTAVFAAAPEDRPRPRPDAQARAPDRAPSEPPIAPPLDAHRRGPRPTSMPAPAILPAVQAFGAALQKAWAAERKPTPRPVEPPTTAAPQGGPVPLATSVEPAAPVLDTADRGWPQAMVERIERLQETADAGSTRIRLLPDALGAIDVAVRRDGELVHVQFTAAEAQTRQWLADAQPRLAEAADARGVRLGRTDISGGNGTDHHGGAGEGRQRPSSPPSHPPRPVPARAAERADPTPTRIA